MASGRTGRAGAAPPADPQRSPPQIVAIGASAGGLAGFLAFFAGVDSPAAAGRAYVLIQHLAPDHPSLLPQLVGRATSLTVTEAAHGQVPEPGHVYTIPPGAELQLRNGRFRVASTARSGERRRPVDALFRSLAKERGADAIGVVLSGSGDDGAAGVRAIKAAGGLVLVQDPASAEHPEMPAAALATGLVDAALVPGRISAEIDRRRAGEGTGPVADAGTAPVDAEAASGEGPGDGGPEGAPGPAAADDDPVGRIIALLRLRTGHDFSGYKPATVGRRIARRMSARHVDSHERYLALLESSPDEVQALFDELFIGVTGFFRDAAAFEALRERAVAPLVASREPGEPVRAWVVGCSTGEEAYSIAMLFHEAFDAAGHAPSLVIFATDLDGRAIATARRGRYAEADLGGVSPERLARWFVKEPGDDAFRVTSVIRDSVVFSVHDALRDPPFSRLDLVSCRNLLIYLDKDSQRRLIPLLHYALRPGGFLLLGSAESVSAHPDLFASVDRKARLHAARDLSSRGWASTRSEPRSRSTGGTIVARGVRPPAESVGSPLRTLVERALLEHVSAVAVLVAGDGEILYVHGRTGRYLEPAPGEVARSNVLRMAREGLSGELAAALRESVATGRIAHRRSVPVRTNGTVDHVDVTIRPVLGGPVRPDGSPLLLVVLEDSPAPDAVSAPPKRGRAGSRAPQEADAAAAAEAEAVVALRQELQANQEIVETALRGLAVTNEELTASNEELQSVNEELQSTNEELETSKEELQSTNEELATVNAELEARVADLSRANDDLSNLVAGTGIATVFVDRALRILRYTPTAPEITNLIPGDIGRPVGQIAPNLVGYDRLTEDAASVLETLVPRTLDVQATDGRWYTLRFQAYRTLDDVISGVVITFVEVTDKKRAEAVLQESEQRFHATVDTLIDPLVILAPRRDAGGAAVDLICQYANGAATEFHGQPLGEMVGRGVLELFGGPDVGVLRVDLLAAMARETPLIRDGYVHRTVRDDRSIERMIDLRARRIDDLLVVSWRDVTALREAEARIRTFAAELEGTVRTRTDALERANLELDTVNSTISHDLRTSLRAIASFSSLLDRHVRASLDERDRHYLDAVRSSAERMGVLLDNLLDYSRVGRHAVKRVPIDWDGVLAPVRLLTEALAEEGSGAFHVEEPLLTAWGDPTLVERILHDLVLNALTYHAPGRPSTATLRTRRDAGGIRVEVVDDGIGIPMAFRDKVFEPFVRLHRDEEYPGTGIGLAIAQRAARLMGTEITLESTVGAGSTFGFLLPEQPLPEDG